MPATLSCIFKLTGMKISLILMMLFVSFCTTAQNTASDVILKVNGEEMKGKVTEVNDDNIKFTYTGETIAYTIKKADILKITFSNGRVEVFNKPALPSEASASPQATPPASNNAAVSPEDRHNKLAILPYHFIIDKQTGDDEMGYKAQEETFVMLNSHTAEIELQDVNTTNALLIKAGINQSNIRGYTPAELCSILGVEYFVQSTITINKGIATATTSNYGTTNVNNNNNKNNNDKKITGSSTSTSNVTQTYRSTVTLNIFNDKGKSIYSQSRQPFFSTIESYKDAVQYIVKRAPVYKK
jgi:hypothetical protein